MVKREIDQLAEDKIARERAVERMAATVALAKFMQQQSGISSVFIDDTPVERFKPENYGVVSGYLQISFIHEGVVWNITAARNK